MTTRRFILLLAATAVVLGVLATLLYRSGFTSVPVPEPTPQFFLETEPLLDSPEPTAPPTSPEPIATSAPVPREELPYQM